MLYNNIIVTGTAKLATCTIYTILWQLSNNKFMHTPDRYQLQKLFSLKDSSIHDCGELLTNQFAARCMNLEDYTIMPGNFLITSHWISLTHSYET